MKNYLAMAAAVAMLASANSAQAARVYVWAAGSSTLFPFSTRVAENFAKKTGRKAPKVESLGTGGGIKLFCSGSGEGFPDIANASRPMKRSEFDQCQKKGVKDIIQLKVGFDGIVVAVDKDGSNYNLTTQHLYQGLAANVVRNGQFVKNPHAKWTDVAAGLPANRILVYGPPPTSGTRDAFIELGIEAGALKFPVAAALKASNEPQFKAKVHPLREDGAWIDSGENDNAIIGTLTKTPGAMGVFGYSFLEENVDKVKGASVNGVRPTAKNITDGTYPLSRSLYIYVKRSMIGVTPGLQEFVSEYVSDAATGRGGYLQGRGLIVLPPAQHAANKAAVKALVPMKRPAS
jgi:phosphate transport system substrate-binding protein